MDQNFSKILEEFLEGQIKFTVGMLRISGLLSNPELSNTKSTQEASN